MRAAGAAVANRLLGFLERVAVSGFSEGELVVATAEDHKGNAIVRPFSENERIAIHDPAYQLRNLRVILVVFTQIHR